MNSGFSEIAGAGVAEVYARQGGECVRCWRKTPSPQPTSRTCEIKLGEDTDSDLIIVERSYRSDALASEDFKSPRAALLVKWGEKLDLGFELCAYAVVHCDGCGADIPRPRRRGLYMQRRLAESLNLNFHA
jgi:hypothetical protein